MAQTPTSSPAVTYEFGDFTRDRVRGQVRRGDQEVPLRPKTFELLAFLVRNGDRLLSKAELLEAVWPETHVTEDSITQCVIEIRKALGDQDQQMLKTVPRRGYLFQAKVSQPAAARLRTPSWFPISARRVTLAAPAALTIFTAPLLPL